MKTVTRIHAAWKVLLGCVALWPAALATVMTVVTRDGVLHFYEPLAMGSFGIYTAWCAFGAPMIADGFDVPFFEEVERPYTKRELRAIERDRRAREVQKELAALDKELGA